MSFKRNKLRDAINFALATSLMSSGLAFAQDTTATTTDSAKELETIQVTGSRIRRVDTETASPVIAIDRASIERSGKLTLGDLVQELPNIAGAPTNPQVNNGGGTGASNIELRGLGSQRTLVLINGRRVVNGTGLGADLNAIPATAVERIEVLSSGASAVYGSDAVAGVVNFIMRSDYQGMEASADVGISYEGDGFRRGASFTWGQTTDKGNVTAGVNYNKYDAINAGARDFSKDATYLYSGSVSTRGSSRNPRGRITLTAAQAATFGCATVTRIPGHQGNALTDYRCYSGAVDSFNYQPENYILTPQERMNGFVLGNYAITDNLTAFVELYHNTTTSKFAIAPLPFDARGDAVVISADNYYNPFGTNFGSDGTNAYNQFLTRFVSLGQRQGNYKTTTDQGVLGIKGVLGDTWQWDAAYNYGHYSLTQQSAGYVYYEGLRAALGPSFLDPVSGNVVCGAPGAIINNCTPVNFFNLDDPAQIANLRNYAVTPFYQTLNVFRSVEINANGEVFDLPAGAANLAVGASHRSEYDDSRVDFVATTTGAAGTCFISQEACSTPQKGGFNVKEFYGELFLPILKDAPFAKSFNIILGSRYSDYSNFGDTVNSKLAIEWKPIDDLLVRGTVSEVFRAPGINDLYAGPAGNAPNFTDRCIGYQQGQTNHNNACGPGSGATNIPVGGITGTGLGQSTGVVSGSIAAGYDLQPEQGKSFNFGMVWDPSFAPGFSAAVDYWRLYLNDTIVTIDAQQAMNICFDNDASPFCGFIHRFSDGQVNYISQPTVNLGRTDTDGVDISLKYRMPETSFGKFSFGLDATHVLQYDNNPDPSDPNAVVTHVGGHYNKSFGNYPDWRALLSIGWTMGDWNVGLKTRYVGKSQVGDADTDQGTSADGGCFVDPIDGPNEFCGVVRHLGANITHNLSAGYNFSAINSRVDIGIDNITNRQPQQLYQNNVINANTDVQTYDTIGRYMWAKFTVKF